MTKRNDKVIGTMVWCESCHTVVWALDSDFGDLRGILNLLKMPCRLCGVEGNYDGHNATIMHKEWLGTFDGWSTMKALANYEELEWRPSKTNVWFDKKYYLDESKRTPEEKALAERAVNE